MENQIIKRIYEKTICDIKTRCWNWTGYLNHNGYGLITINGKTHRVHRIIYQKLCDPIPEDKPCILHRCDNPKCCNPMHLYDGTLQDNAIDRSKRNPKSYQIGEKHGRTHLTEKDILEIRASTEVQSVIAKRFNVSRENISYIRLRKTWKHI